MKIYLVCCIYSILCFGPEADTILIGTAHKAMHFAPVL